MPPEGLLVILIGALGAAGFGTGSWFALTAPFLAVPAFYLGLDRGWWGYGLGDGWQYAMLAILAIAVAVTAGGILARRAAGVQRRADRGRG
jgi:hypothetical protein